MAELHPSKTGRGGTLDGDVIRKGLNADTGPYSEARWVYCKQCGFPCNLDRDLRGLTDFAGETIISGNLISNGSFENWTGGSPDSWTLSGSVSQVQTAGYFDPSDDGTSSLNLTQTGLTSGGALLLQSGLSLGLQEGGRLLLVEGGIVSVSLSQTMTSLSSYGNNFLSFRARVKSLTNDVMRLRISINDVHYYSFYNIAQQAFQEVTVGAWCPATVSTLHVYVLADNASGTAYVDQVVLSRNGSPTTASVQAGCAHCGSFNYV